MDPSLETDPPKSSLPNTKSRRLLLAMGVVFAVVWIPASLFLAPAIKAPGPWTQIGGAVILGFGFGLASSKTPLKVVFGADSITFRHLIRRNKIRRGQITFIEYRLLISQVAKPVNQQYYAASIWSGKRRSADVGIDGPIAQRLMAWFGPEKSIVRIRKGGRVVEERRAVPENH